MISSKYNAKPDDCMYAQQLFGWHLYFNDDQLITFVFQTFLCRFCEFATFFLFVFVGSLIMGLNRGSLISFENIREAESTYGAITVLIFIICLITKYYFNIAYFI